ncbi:MAG: DNA-processing protein DprA [Desulfotomaculaceae bacterium]|nr:DNA-processing protein DprA [Desulfotomaculaceae bacterium]
MASKFVEMGYVIVSGLAKGIDTGGHIGALDAKGITIAVLPGKLEDILPKSNRDLAERSIKNKSLLISEYHLGQDFRKKNFIEYCRIQSGLSLGFCLVQADVNGF